MLRHGALATSLKGLVEFVNVAAIATSAAAWGVTSLKGEFVNCPLDVRHLSRPSPKCPSYIIFQAIIEQRIQTENATWVRAVHIPLPTLAAAGARILPTTDTMSNFNAPHIYIYGCSFTTQVVIVFPLRAYHPPMSIPSHTCGTGSVGNFLFGKRLHNLHWF